MQYLFSQQAFKTEWKICEGIVDKREQAPQTYKEFRKDLQKTQMGVWYNITYFISSSCSNSLEPLKHLSHPSGWLISRSSQTLQSITVENIDFAEQH